MRKNQIKILFAAIILALIALLANSIFGHKKSENLNKLAPQSQQQEIKVLTFTIKEEPVTQFIDLPGRVVAHKTAAIRPQIDGIITKQNFEEGAFVKKGKQLYQIDSAIYQASYDQAKENFRAAAAKKNRFKKLLAYEAVSKQEFDDASAAMIQAKSELRKAKINLGYTRVYAPISGYIGKSNITEGGLVSANQDQHLTTIVQLDPVFVDMMQPAAEAVKLKSKSGLTVSLSIDDDIAANSDLEQSDDNFIHKKYLGKLKTIESFADEESDSVRLRALFTNKNHRLIPGMLVNAKIHLLAQEKITVPQKATTRLPDGSLMVWVVDAENMVKKRIIKADQTFEDRWIVESGLGAGEIVVLEGIMKLADGVKISADDNLTN